MASSIPAPAPAELAIAAMQEARPRGRRMPWLMRLGLGFVALLAVLLVTLLLFLAAGQIAAVVGDAAMTLTSRVMGILLMALAAEFVVQGLRDSLLK